MSKTIISARIEEDVLADVRNTGTPITSAIEQGLVWWLRRQRKRTATTPSPASSAPAPARTPAARAPAAHPHAAPAPASLLARLRATGTAVALDGEHILIQRPDLLSDDLMVEIRARRAEVVAELLAERTHPAVNRNG
jgi:hypothetical protein